MITQVLLGVLLARAAIGFAQAPTVTVFSVPASETDSAARLQQIAANRAGNLYRPSPLGNVSYFLTGPLGDARVKEDVNEFRAEASGFRPLLQLDAQKSALAAQLVIVASRSQGANTIR